MGQASSSVNEKDVLIDIDTSSSIYTDDNPNASMEEHQSIEETHDGYEQEDNVDFVDPNAPLLLDHDDDNPSLLELNDGDDDGDDADGIDSTASVAGFTTRSSTLSTKWNSDDKEETTVSPPTPPSSFVSDVSATTPLSSAKTLASLSDVLHLPNKEIKERMQRTHISIASLKEARANVLRYNLTPGDDVDSWYHDKNAVKKHKICATHTSSKPSTPQRPLSPGQALLRAQAQKEFAQTHMELALFVLKISPSLKTIRFKMVPAKLSECNFWNAVFYLLLTKEERLHVREEALVRDCNNDGIMPKVNGTDADNSGHQVHQLLVNKNEKIVQLQQQILQLEEELANALQTQQSIEDSNKINVHTGQWIMEKESQEFLGLDEEIKSKLRDGKQQRLRDVEEQMKFILDSDADVHSRGNWDCCGKKDYTSTCAC
jgi:hypothetical protein